MNGFRILLVIALVVVGLGPATAQDIFINRNKDRAETSKPSIYIRRPSSDREQSYSTRSRFSPSNTHTLRSQKRQGFKKEKIRLAHNANNVSDKIEVFRAWQESGRKPRTLEEITSYAKSKRAVNEAVMLKRRQMLVAYQEKRAQERSLRLATMNGGESTVIPSFDGASSGANKGEPASTTVRQTLRKPDVFVSPKRQREPGGVFTNYR